MDFMFYIFIFILLVGVCKIFTGAKKTTIPSSLSSGKNKKKIRNILENKKLEGEVYKIVMEWSDAEFETWVLQNKRALKRKYRNLIRSGDIRIAQLKNALKNVVNAHTNKIKIDRLRVLQTEFPYLRRYFFGPGINKIIYAKRRKHEKFYFVPKDGEELPKIFSLIDLAILLDTPINVLLGYCYISKPQSKRYYIKGGNYKASIEDKSRFYKRKIIPKKNGGKRVISIPKYKLKILQKWILENILNKVKLNEYCTAFKPGSSIVDNASPHVGAKTLVKIDLKDFFPSIKLEQVIQVFNGFGFNKPVAGVLARLCSDYYKGKVFLPQGAPTSPMIANLYASKLDIRLAGLWANHGFRYTRYADDLTFSSYREDVDVGKLIFATYEIIKDEKLEPNYKKTRVYRSGNRMEVTGIVVNQKLNIKRDWVRLL
ncbi:MAG: reverse transcriptase family protein, partial [Promethearchaeota archaeon]